MLDVLANKQPVPYTLTSIKKYMIIFENSELLYDTGAQ
jgi:hypothetical protein